MRPRRPEGEPSDDLFRARLSNQLDRKHPLVRLAGLIEWASFESEFGALYHEVLGRPGKPTRLMVGLTYRAHWGERDGTAARGHHRCSSGWRCSEAFQL